MPPRHVRVWHSVSLPGHVTADTHSAVVVVVSVVEVVVVVGISVDVVVEVVVLVVVVGGSLVEVEVVDGTV